MFANKAKKTAPHRVPAPDAGTVKAFLGAGSEFEGRMVFNEAMRLDGIFRGEISSDNTLIVGASADLKAEIAVDTLIISGVLNGRIKATGRVELRAPAKITGDIQTPSISIEPGVIFNGTITMQEDAPLAAASHREDARAAQVDSEVLD